MFRATLLCLMLLAFLSDRARACPFCNVQGQTLSGEVIQADMILLGTLKNAKANPVDFGKGTTELHIESVVKDHPYLGGRKVITLPKYLPADPASPDAKFLVFCSVYAPASENGVAAVVSGLGLTNFDRYTLDPYRGEMVKADGKLATYLKGAIAVREKNQQSKLKFFFDYLDAEDLLIGTDAFLEFANADYKDVQALSEKLPAAKLTAWLKDKQTPVSRFGLYALMLGHTGNKDAAAALRELLDDSRNRFLSGFDGLLAGYILLDPKAGWEYLVTLAKDPGKDFQVRYSTLKVLQFFWTSRPDVIKKAQVLDGMKLMIAQADVADLPIEYLRKWECYDLTADILAAGRLPSHKEIPIVRRAILKYAMTVAAKDPNAAQFLAEARKDDPERVKLIEDLLKEEQSAALPAKK